MVVPVYQIAPKVWSFRKQPGAKSLKLRVPKGSSLLAVRSMGLVLFVPNPDVPQIRGGWNPAQAVQEARREGGRFEIILAAEAKRQAG